jgi:hypothetical protein
VPLTTALCKTFLLRMPIEEEEDRFDMAPNY